MPFFVCGHLKLGFFPITLLQCEKAKIFSFCLLSGNVKSLAQSPLFQCSRVKQKAPCLGRSLRNLGPLGLTWSFLLGAVPPPPVAALKPTAAPAVSGMTGMSSGSRSADASQLQSPPWIKSFQIVCQENFEYQLCILDSCDQCVWCGMNRHHLADIPAHQPTGRKTLMTWEIRQVVSVCST